LDAPTKAPEQKMEKQRNPGLWIGAAALAAVIVMLVALPGKKDPAPQEAIKEPETKKASATVEPKPAQPAAPTVQPPPAPTVAVAPVAPASAPQIPAAPPQDSDAPPPAPEKPPTPADQENTLRVLDNVQFALRDYRTALGGNPVGTNAEITSSLLGNNLKQVKIPLPDGSTINGAGEMCDPWGTPLFFHQQSGTKMEIRSAGPDRKMHTPDDVMM
jgi:type IV secretory pathway VirB10-like protein